MRDSWTRHLIRLGNLQTWDTHWEPQDGKATMTGLDNLVNLVTHYQTGKLVTLKPDTKVHSQFIMYLFMYLFFYFN